MPTPTPPATESAYELEASTWQALDGRIPGHPLHDAQAWADWRAALRIALKVAAAEKARRSDGPAQPR